MPRHDKGVRVGWIMPFLMVLSLLVIAGFLYAGYADKHRTWLTLGAPDSLVD